MSCDHMDIPLPPGPDDAMGTDFDFEVPDDLSLLIRDLDVFDEAVNKRGEACRVESGGSAAGGAVEVTDQRVQGIRKAIPIDVAEERVERTRERNRRAQARYRQKLKDQCASLEFQVTELQARLRAAKKKQAGLRHEKEEHVDRFARANHDLSAVSTQIPDPQLARAVGSPATPQSASQPGLHNAVTLVHSHASQPTSSLWKTLIRSTAIRGLCTDPDAPPAPIHSYSHLAGISYELLQTAARNFLDDPSSCQGSRSVIDEHKQSIANRLSCSTAEVCWFLVLYIQVAPGLHLSYSSSLSSPECVASFLMSYLCSSVEFGMITAALDAEGTGAACEGAAEAQDPKRVRISTPASEYASTHSPSTGKQHMHHGGATDGTGIRPGGTADTTRTQATHPAAPQPCACPPRGSADAHATNAWSGNVRCSVNHTACARSAAAAVLREAIEPYVGLLPQSLIRRLLRAAARQARVATIGSPSLTSGYMLGSPRGGNQAGVAQVAGGSSERPGGAAEQYQAGVTEAIYGLVELIADSADALLEELPAMVARSSGSPGPSRAWLLDRSCVVMSSLSLGYSETFRSAPRVIRQLAFAGVIPLISFYEVENMQAMLYRSLHTTPRQRDRMAAYWSVWERRKRELDGAMHAARDSLQGLSPVDLPMHLLAHVSVAAAAGGCAQRRGGVCLGVETAVSVGGGAGAPGGDVRLLGSCPEATDAARDALEATWAVHAADAELYAHILDLQMQPALILGLDQVARVFSVHLMHDAAPVDFMALCQLAKTQQHREEMFQRRALGE